MKIRITYSFLLMLLFSQVSIYANSDLIASKQIDSLTKQIDSLLQASYQEVYNYPNKSIELGKETFNNPSYSKKTRTQALMLISLGYTSKRDYQKALEYIIRANELSSDIDDQRLRMTILFRTGILYQQLRIYDKSIEFLERLEELSLSYPVRDSVYKQLANVYLVKGFIYKDNLNCDIALEFFDKGIKEYENVKGQAHLSNLSIAHYNKGNCYTLLSKYDKAKLSFNKSIELAQSAKAISLISFAQKGLAEVYKLEGKYEEAIVLLHKALKQSTEVGDLVLYSSIYKELFEDYLALNKWDEYQEYYNLYLKTQLKVKISERNSINDSILENSKRHNEKIAEIRKQFKNKLLWVVLIIIIIIFGIILIKKKSKKNIKTLHKRIKTIQNIKSNP